MLPISLPSVLDKVAHQEVVVGAFLLGCGLMFMIMGVRLAPLMVALSYGVIGFVVAACTPLPDMAKVMLGLALGGGLAAGSLFVLRPAVIGLAGLWVALAVMTMLGGAGLQDQVVIACAAVGLIGGCSLGVIMKDEAIAFVTSLEGCLLLIGGLVLMVGPFLWMVQNPTLWHHLRDLLVNNAIFAPFLVLAGTTTGFYLQLAELQKKRVGRSG